ncbi:sensor histidine kinase [Mucilaginibacter rubeus]|uniref:histidine kinase n=1 Tax=Mucilaginibacter rubeus TaxID=2027860 RepID=A0AAE6MHL3_9SPHI|nr:MULTISPECIES: sensor histidine kinase [Mucilaginibacter]QEM03740.1 sensor histidine kinase [Mucilaginibacter rubeus]QEM16351.1 sensor histidine kinase [Mucilaginibacter gossypii]QTE40882.1 sensor histidine kinase [Mucilaginibacter rubeus]QTE47485.1 sensor histidine kinase [Mucilaginibacter rubeus]QTE58878.1 sensor histidine kinase [Mucilaginibacter rubeus]
MRKPILLFILVGTIFLCRGQEIKRQQADQLLKIVQQKVTDTAHIHALLTLAEFNIFKKGQLKTDLDSARLFIDQAKRMNTKIKSITAYGYTALVESYLARKIKQEEIAKVLNDKAVQLLSDAKNYYHLGQAYYQRATYYNPYDDSGSSKVLDLYTKGIEAFKMANNVERQAYGYKRLGEYDNAVQTTLEKLLKSLALYKSIHYQAVQEVYDLIAVAYLYDTNLQKALSYALLALKTAELDKDTTMQLCAINNHLGLIFYRKHDYKNSTFYFVKALKTAETYNDVNTIYFLCVNIVNSCLNTEQPIAAKRILQQVLGKYPAPKNDMDLSRITNESFVKIYTKLNQIDNGRPYAEALRTIDLKYKNKLNVAKLIEDNFIMSKFYLAAQSFGQATDYMKKSEELLAKNGTAYDRSALYSLKFRIDTAKGNYRSAVQHLIHFNKIQDSIFNERKAVECQKQQVQYETEKKDQQIKLLQQNELLQQTKLKHAGLVQNLTLGGIIVMLIISALIYRIYKQKKAANAIITHKNELLQQLLTGKEWLLKEVHHRVKNNLHTVICLLESQAQYLENDALKAIESSQHRIYAMSLIHQKLYQSDEIKTIDMAFYIPELVLSLQDSFDTFGKIHFIIDVEKIELGISHAIPLGLILNEAVTNCIKYAFPGDRNGDVFILMSENDGLIKLEIIDNGIGMPQNQCQNGTESLGLKLISGLSADIHADYCCEAEYGTKITISFRNQNLTDSDRYMETGAAIV